jgi:hypothetical protein
MIEELMEGNKQLMIFLAIPGVIILTVLIMYFVNRMMKRKLQPLATALGGELVTSFIKGIYIRLLNYSSEVRIRLTSGGQNSPPFLIIEQMAPLGFELSVSKENIATRKMEKWGLLKDIKVGDPLFDDNYLIRSSDPVRAQTFLLDSSRRQAVDHFFSHGFTDLQLKKDSITLRKPGYRSEDLDPELMRSHLENLQKLAGE